MERDITAKLLISSYTTFFIERIPIHVSESSSSISFLKCLLQPSFQRLKALYPQQRMALGLWLAWAAVVRLEDKKAVWKL